MRKYTESEAKTLAIMLNLTCATFEAKVQLLLEQINAEKDISYSDGRIEALQEIAELI